MKVFHEAAMSSDGISQESTFGGGMIKLSLFQNVTSSNMDVLKLYDIILLGYTQSFAAKGKWCEKKYLRYSVFLVRPWRKPHLAHDLMASRQFPLTGSSPLSGWLRNSSLLRGMSLSWGKIDKKRINKM